MFGVAGAAAKATDRVALLNEPGAAAASTAQMQRSPGLQRSPRATGWLASLQQTIDESLDELKQDDLWAESGHTRIIFSPYTWHYRASAEHRDVYAIGVEQQRADQWLAGASLFRNSFGQPSAFVYLGRRFPELAGQPSLYGQVAAGVLYGYQGKYRSKVPLNVGGFAPGLVVSAGWQFAPRWSAIVHALGDAGLMFQLTYDLR
jgi:hypothetical protein